MRKKKRLLAFILTLVMIVSSIGVMPANTQVSAASKVKVTNVTNKKKTMYVGAIYNLKTNKKAVTFSSNKPSVVKVTNTGTLYAKKKGTAYITVKDANGTKIKVKVTVKKAKGFKVRKISGTYSSTVKVKITAKQNYKVYYSTSAKFKKNKVVKSGKSKTLTLKKTKTLRIFVVKNSAKVKVKTMNKQSSRWKDIRFVQYKYIIKSGTEAETVTEVPENTETSTETITENTETTTESTSESTEATTEATENTEVITETTTETTTESSTEDTGEEIPEEPVEEPELNISSSSDSEDNPGFTYTDNDGIKTLEIIQDGTFVLSGGTEDVPIKNTQIIIASELGEVNVTLDNLVLDNSELGTSAEQDGPVITVGDNVTNVNFELIGNTVIYGNGSYTEEPAKAIIYADDTDTTLTFSASDDDATLTIIDSLPQDTDLNGNDPTDGIYSKGKLIIQSGTYHITTNGDCLKGTGKKGEGGVEINGGTFALKSYLGNGIRSKSGNIVINDGSIFITHTGEDGINAKSYGVTINGGSISIDNCYGDGIQGETVSISGENTWIKIKTYYQYAGKNFYNTELGKGFYNTLHETDEVKTEVVNVDTGSHKGIKGGTKENTYSYNSVEENSDNEVYTEYTEEASGGIVITGGAIYIDTTMTGIKYNGSGGNGGFGGNMGNNSSTGNISPACDSKYIIGAPEDAIHSNNTCDISGGDITIYSSDDGITGPKGVEITGSASIKIKQCYEGIEGGSIVIGAEGEEGPEVIIYSNDDGVNASSKTVTYTYEDEEEEQYTKVEKSVSDNTLTVYSGYLNVMIGDDVTHSYSLAYDDSVDEIVMTESDYTSDGDGIDCNGSMDIQGGTVIVYGGTSGDNGPVDTESGYTISGDATVLIVGSGMINNPSTVEHGYIVTSSSGNSGSNNRPGGNNNMGSSASSSSISAVAIENDGSWLLSIKPEKSYSYLFYSSPDLEAGTNYTMYSGGNVTGDKMYANEEAYDYRYTEYEKTTNTTSSTVSAK